MRRKALQLWKKLNFRFGRFYTWMKIQRAQELRRECSLRLPGPP